MKTKITTYGLDTETPMAWVGCLGCYTGGRLNGQWLDAEQASDLVKAGLAVRVPGINLDGTGDPEGTPVCPTCGGDEFEVFDVANAPASTGGSIPAFCELAGVLEEAGALNALPFIAFCENGGHGKASYADIYEMFEDSYVGEWSSMGQYAAELEGDFFGHLPQQLRYYIDYEKLGRDMELEGSYWTLPTPDGTVWVFQS